MTDLKNTSPTAARRRLLGAALAATASLALPGLARSQAASARALRLGFIGPGKKLASATGWALQQGQLQRELAPLGFGEVVTRVFPNGPDLNEAFVSGNLDVGIYGDTPAVVARAQGFEGRLLGFDNVGMNVWLLTPRGGVKTVRELEGKTVGVALGSYMHRYVLGLLKEAKLLKAVKVVHMLPRDGEPALERGAVAAFAAPINTGPLLASRGYPVIDEAERHPTLRGTSVIVASPQLLAAAPGLPAAWGRARTVALQDIRRDNAAYYAFHAEASGFPVAAVKDSYPLSHFPDTAYPAEGLRLIEEVKRFLLAENLIRRDFSVAQWTVAGAD
ncbi:ABC transporter substrate-binding protein [Polaromonas sp. JS666]|uniref:ABC transporter substrate-binding protein n=1 Tax=Polaromonas sp. (strain JS666 / ATCC BAA-500) TaxID=296591 RepID=UPI00087E4F9A|nr:ABC transporter substrate-binding protein [Polaromonas sp. JS666]SDN64760.1 NitT/TauT family transport system substrate-binding protein [Polaromonas sp. JS666]